MKKLNLLLLGVGFIISNFVTAQNPYASIGKTAKPMLSLSDGQYVEHFENDSVRQIGSAMVNVYTEQLIAFVDPREEARQIHSQTNSRFLSVDPLARQYPFYTPYQFAGNKPIWAIDLDGKEEFFVTDYRDVSGALYKTVITVVSAKGMEQGQHTVYRSTVQLTATGHTTSAAVVTTGTTSGKNAFANANERSRALGTDPTGLPITKNKVNQTLETDSRGNQIPSTQYSTGIVYDGKEIKFSQDNKDAAGNTINTEKTTDHITITTGTDPNTKSSNNIRSDENGVSPALVPDQKIYNTKALGNSNGTTKVVVDQPAAAPAP